METKRKKAADFIINDYVVYRMSEVCKLISVESRSFDGKNKIEYFKLTPITSESSTYYVPVDRASDSLRKILSKDEIYSLLDSASSQEIEWNTDNRERKMMFDEILKSADYSKIICMMKAIHLHRKERKCSGRKLMACDENVMRTAENVVYQEFSIALDMPVEEIEDFIIEQVEGSPAECESSTEDNVLC